MVSFYYIYLLKVLILGKLKSGNSSKYSQDSENIPMTEDDIKLFELTKNNTITNRDILNKEKEYMKTIEPKYKEIYGDKGVKFFEEENKNEVEKINENTYQNEQVNNRNKKGKVRFSSIVQYSRN